MTIIHDMKMLPRLVGGALSERCAAHPAADRRRRGLPVGRDPALSLGGIAPSAGYFGFLNAGDR
jgi:hypothetical protein